MCNSGVCGIRRVAVLSLSLSVKESANHELVKAGGASIHDSTSDSSRQHRLSLVQSVHNRTASSLHREQQQAKRQLVRSVDGVHGSSWQRRRRSGGRNDGHTWQRKQGAACLKYSHKTRWTDGLQEACDWVMRESKEGQPWSFSIPEE